MTIEMIEQLGPILSPPPAVYGRVVVLYPNRLQQALRKSSYHTVQQCSNAPSPEGWKPCKAYRVVEALQYMGWGWSCSPSSLVSKASKAFWAACFRSEALCDSSTSAYEGEQALRNRGVCGIALKDEFMAREGHAVCRDGTWTNCTWYCL